MTELNLCVLISCEFWGGGMLCRTNWSADFVITICARMPCAQPCCIELPCLIKPSCVCNSSQVYSVRHNRNVGPTSVCLSKDAAIFPLL